MPHHIPIEDSIDLHSFHPRDVVSVAEEYVRAAAAAGLREVPVSYTHLTLPTNREV